MKLVGLVHRRCKGGKGQSGYRYVSHECFKGMPLAAFKNGGIFSGLDGCFVLCTRMCIMRMLAPPPITSLG